MKVSQVFNKRAVKDADVIGNSVNAITVNNKGKHVICLSFAGMIAFSGSAGADETQAARLEALEKQLAQQQRKITALEGAAPTRLNAKVFNPDISLILSGRYVHMGSGDTPSHAELFNGEEETFEAGFGLGESELILSANADDHFYGQMTLAVASEEGESVVELEEAFIQTTVTPGLKAKAGRFLSGFGYQNEQHPHAWDLSIAPLVYRYFLAGGVNDDGVQFQYVLPTSTWVMVGAEALKGGAYPATADSGVGSWAAYLNVGADLGDKASWLVGLNRLQVNIADRPLETEALAAGEGSAQLSGDARVDSLEGVFKYAPTGNMKQQHFKLQAEYMRSREKGDGTVEVPETLTAVTPYHSDRDGYYLQATYQWDPRWRSSLRHDRLKGKLQADNAAIAAAGLTTPWTPKQVSAAVDWVPSEFSRVRLQYTSDETPADQGDLWLVEYTVSLGVHGAHRY